MGSRGILGAIVHGPERPSDRSVRGLLYGVLLVGFFGSLVALDFARRFYTEVANPQRGEYVEGVLLSSVAFGIFWLLAPGLALLYRRRLRHLEILLAFAPASLWVALLLLLRAS